MKKLLHIVLFGLLFCSLACAGRQPTAKTAQSVTNSYFKAYGRKFPSSPFGGNNLRGVTINSVEEVSYRFALADELVQFVDGHMARVLVRMENKFPGGWRVVSWEVAGYK